METSRVSESDLATGSTLTSPVKPSPRFKGFSPSPLPSPSKVVYSDRHIPVHRKNLSSFFSGVENEKKEEDEPLCKDQKMLDDQENDWIRASLEDEVDYGKGRSRESSEMRYPLRSTTEPPVLSYRDVNYRTDTDPVDFLPTSNDSHALKHGQRSRLRLPYQVSITPRKPSSRVPFKVLDAPNLQDDFYLNLLDWSSTNCVAVALGPITYIWSAHTGKVIQLMMSASWDRVTSLSWDDAGGIVAVGLKSGSVELWDVFTRKKVGVLPGVEGRIGCLTWKGSMLCAGSRQGCLKLWDVRSSKPSRMFQGHSEEVCGLRWSPDLSLLASGGNDNKVFIWSENADIPIQKLSYHSAAVKALSWSRTKQGLLATGGGTMDHTLCFWNVHNGQLIKSVDSGSQVCNLAWSHYEDQLVSTHGYSMNHILVWDYERLTPISKLTGHTNRVLYMSMSPDGESIVTGASDDTLRFWKIFDRRPLMEAVHSNAQDTLCRIR